MVGKVCKLSLQIHNLQTKTRKLTFGNIFASCVFVGTKTFLAYCIGVIKCKSEGWCLGQIKFK
ncbi:MAG: hypothetical protein CMP12_06155 [Zunongwangia sp.]|jgi:hypothetical protein|nr:hypothetical protein [Flavobacteriaceae bacterium]MAO35485.1 hypothetical protein [Zunongwangia sp.]